MFQINKANKEEIYIYIIEVSKELTNLYVTKSKNFLTYFLYFSIYGTLCK